MYSVTKMKKIPVLFFALTFLMMGLTSCDTVDLNSETNDMIKGVWELESFVDDNEERMGIALTTATIEFISSNSSGGSSNWVLNTVLGTTQDYDINYSVINDGKEINFAGDIFTLEFIGEKIKMTGSTDSSDVIIEAKKQ